MTLYFNYTIDQSLANIGNFFIIVDSALVPATSLPVSGDLVNFDSYNNSPYTGALASGVSVEYGSSYTGNGIGGTFIYNGEVCTGITGTSWEMATNNKSVWLDGEPSYLTLSGWVGVGFETDSTSVVFIDGVYQPGIDPVTSTGYAVGGSFWYGGEDTETLGDCWWQTPNGSWAWAAVGPWYGTSYGPDGYNHDGYDYGGYDRYGFDGLGYNASGYDSSGYDQSGYNTSGYNSSGYNSIGQWSPDNSNMQPDGFTDSMNYWYNGYLNQYGADSYGDALDVGGYNQGGRDIDGRTTAGFDRSGHNASGQYSVDGYSLANGNYGEFWYIDGYATTLDTSGNGIYGGALFSYGAQSAWAPFQKSGPAQVILSITGNQLTLSEASGFSLTRTIPQLDILGAGLA